MLPKTGGPHNEERGSEDVGLSDVTVEEWPEILNMDPAPDERPPGADICNHD